MLMTFNQIRFDVRCEWGQAGVSQLAPISDVIIIVDVLSFSTSVEIATSRGATVFPYLGAHHDLPGFAASVGAVMATSRWDKSGYSLAPSSLLNITAGTRLVIPSPNGSRLTLETGDVPTLAGCLRNARAVAVRAQELGQRIAVIPAGERWRQDGSLRPALEDWLGAGAIINHLAGSLSPLAQAAAASFLGLRSQMPTLLRQCGSGQELAGRGWLEDVALASELDVSACVPQFMNGAYQPC